MKYLFLDVETTGIIPQEHSITQIAGLIEIDGEIKDKVVLDIAPIIGAKIDPEALKITGKTLEEINSYPPPYKQLEVFTEFLQKYISPYDKKDKLLFLAYNAPFDFDFMRNFFSRQNNNYFGSYFWHPPIDIMTLAMNFLKQERSEMHNFKLSTVASYLGLEVDNTELHDAYYDIQLTYEVYQKISSPKIHLSKPQEKIVEPYKETLF